jgi:hypothetical protein
MLKKVCKIGPQDNTLDLNDGPLSELSEPHKLSECHIESYDQC